MRENDVTQRTGNKWFTTIFFLFAIGLVIVGIFYLQKLKLKNQNANEAAIESAMVNLQTETVEVETEEVAAEKPSLFGEKVVATEATATESTTAGKLTSEPISLSPTQIFLAMKQASAQAQTLIELLNVRQKFATKAQQQEIAILLKTINLMSDEQKNETLKTMTEMIPTYAQLTEIKETATADRAELTVQTNVGKVGTVTLIKENDEWRIVAESWVDANE